MTIWLHQKHLDHWATSLGFCGAFSSHHQNWSGWKWVFAALNLYRTWTNRTPSGNNLKHVWGWQIPRYPWTCSHFHLQILKSQWGELGRVRRLLQRDCTCTLGLKSPEHAGHTAHVLAGCGVDLQALKCILGALKAKYVYAMQHMWLSVQSSLEGNKEALHVHVILFFGDVPYMFILPFVSDSWGMSLLPSGCYKTTCHAILDLIFELWENKG